MPSTFNEKTTNYAHAQSGQILIIVLILMVLALSIGITVSSRFFKSVRNLSDTDLSNKALGVAEALVERMLIKSQQQLEDFINYGNCGTDCALTITDTGGISATAIVTLSYEGNSSETFLLPLKENDYGEINMIGYGNNAIYICWNSSDGLPSVVASLVYGTKGSYALDSYAYNSINSPNGTNNFSTATAGFGYGSCFSVAGRTNSVLLRLKPLYTDLDVVIVPVGGTAIPKQGISIEATGISGAVSKKIKVVRSFTFLPSQFDYILYQKDANSPLSN